MELRLKHEIALIFIAVLLQLPYFLHATHFFDSDEAFNALLCQQIMRGRAVPTAIPGAESYQGITEVLWSIPWQRLLGPRVYAYKVGVYILYLGLILLMFNMLCAIGFSQRLAWWATLPLAFNTWHLNYFAFFSVGGHMTITVFGSACVYCYVMYQKKPRAFYAMAIPILLGIAFYTYRLAYIYLLFFVTLFILRKGLIGGVRWLTGTRHGRWSVLGGLLGLGPLWLARHTVPGVPAEGGPTLAGPFTILKNLVLTTHEIVPAFLGFDFWRSAEHAARLNIHPDLIYRVLETFYLGIGVFFWCGFSLNIKANCRPF